MYMHEATKHPNKAQFIKAMQKKCYDQLNNGNLSLKHISEVPEGATILPVIWKIKRNRDTKTRQIKKYKARLSIDGSRMVHRKHYEQVATWNSIRTLFI